MKNLKIALTALSVLFAFSSAKSQTVNGLTGSKIISTAVPFLTISPDARAGAMGDAGVSSSPDVASSYYNAAKYAFIEDKAGLEISYTPWLRKLVNDIDLAYLSGYYKLDDLSAVHASLTYFSLGDITFTTPDGDAIGTFKPNEFAISAGYSRKFSDVISGSVSFKFIYSDLTQGQGTGSIDSKPGTSFAADLGLYYQKDITLFQLPAELAWGVQISNIGNKISYNSASDEKYFIPTNLRFGPRVSLDVDDYNKVSVMLDFNKLLVPTPDRRTDIDDNGDPTIILEPSDVSVFEGMLESLYKAPGGFSEKLQEITLGFGAEWLYDNTFALRGGFFYEDKEKGNRKYATLGAGLKYNVLDLNFSYLVPVQQQNPLENTIRISLVFNLPK